MGVSQKACKVRVEGKVHRAGYRRFILDTALELGVLGYVKNEKDGSVTVFAQGAGPRLNQFLERIKTPPQPVAVKSFAEKVVNPNLKIKHFEVKFGSLAEELQEGFGAMEKEFRDYRLEFKGFRGEFRDYRREFRDYRQEFRSFSKRTDQSFKVLGERYGEISAKLTQVLETLQKESIETRKELTRAVDTLSELVKQFLGKRK